MTIEYQNADEFRKVEAARKKSGRPTYFNASQLIDLEISEDLEAALILLPADAKQECRQRFDAQNEQSDRVQTRDSILKAALKQDIDNAQVQVDELQQKVTDLQEFKAKFQTYADVGEIGLILRDAQLDMDELVMAYDRAKHRAVVAGSLIGRTDLSTITPALDKERKSWTRVLSEYSAT